jgi:hypothetical protein
MLAAHKFLPDQYNRIHGFRVEITGGEPAEGNEGSWLSVSHSGLRFEVETGAVTIGPDQFQNSALGRTNWGEITLCGNLTNKRAAVKNIYMDMLQKGDAGTVYRTITITMIGHNGQDVHAVTFNDCFLTSFTMSSLNSTEENVPCLEYSTWQVGFSQDYLGK